MQAKSPIRSERIPLSVATNSAVSHSVPPRQDPNLSQGYLTTLSSMSKETTHEQEKGLNPDLKT